MAKIVSLGKARKCKARAEAKAQAGANAIAFGRTKAEKAQDRLQKARAARDLDGKKTDGT